MMAANGECTHVTEKETDNQASPENSGVVELSSIVEPVTPADVVVQRQIREVILLQNAAVAHLHESVSSTSTSTVLESTANIKLKIMPCRECAKV